MYWKERMITSRFSMTVGLFLIGALHTMIFALFQIPGNFLLGGNSPDFAIACKFILYVSAISASLSHQFVSRRFGLKKVLIGGLSLNVLGLLILFSHEVFSVHSLFSDGMSLLNMVFFGVALTSVINSLVTYIIIEYPERTGMGIIALFAVFNLGVMLAPLIHDFLGSKLSALVLIPVLMALLGIAMAYIWNKFFNPTFPHHLNTSGRDLSFGRNSTIDWDCMSFASPATLSPRRLSASGD